MLTLPAEITNNKNKTTIQPLIFIEFVDLDYHIASKSYDLEVGSGGDGDTTGGSKQFDSASATFQTWNAKAGDKLTISTSSDYVIDTVDSQNQVTLTEQHTLDSGLSWEFFNVYADEINRGISMNLRSAIPQLINAVSSKNSFILHLLDWEDSLRSNLIGSSPDLTGSAIKVYLKFDTSTDLRSNAVQIYAGVIADYSVKDNTMSIKLKPAYTTHLMLPINKIIDSYSAFTAGADICKPLQYGDFNWGLGQVAWGDRKSYAQCIYVGKNESNQMIFWVADHVMENMKTTSTDYADANFQDPYMLMRINNTWMRLVPTIASSQNTSGGAFLVVSAFDATRYLYLPATDEYSAENDPTDWIDVCDGDLGTDINVVNLETLSIKNFKIKEYFFDDLFDLDSNSIGFKIIIDFGTISTDGTISTVAIQFVDDSASTRINEVVDTSDSNTVWTSSSTASSSLTNMLGDARIRIVVSDDHDIASVTVQSILLLCENATALSTSTDLIEYMTNNPTSVFIKSQGREYSGTWGGRKTAGNLIENPADVIESIFRDEMGITSLGTDFFDDVFTTFDDDSVNFCGTIYKQQNSRTLLNNLCKQFNVAMTENIIGYWNLLFPEAATYNFSSSGTGTPGNEDIFTDTDSITGGIYSQHPILKDSLKLKRSDPNKVFEKLTIEYHKILDNYLKSVSVGSGNLYTIQNSYISDTVSATAFRDLIDSWFQNQKWLCSFTTWYNAIAHEVGDIINIRHSAFNDAMLNATVNTQKWMIIDMQVKSHPGLVDITAIELF